MTKLRTSVVVTTAPCRHYTITVSRGFLTSLSRCPKKVLNAWEKSAYERLQSNAEQADGQVVKKLVGHPGHWRYRIADDYRIIYTVEAGIVTLLKAGNRRDIYEGKITADPATTQSRRVEFTGRMRDQSEPQRSPTPNELEITQIAPVLQGAQQDNLPPFTTEQLASLGANQKEIEALLKCQTADALLNAPVCSELIDRILEHLFPSNAPSADDAPQRVIPTAEDMCALIAGTKSLLDFQLKLDSEQENILVRFKEERLVGPFIIKGGPGSGKSTLALYCAAHVASHRHQRINVGPRRKVLVVTYTNSLTRMSKAMLRMLMGESPNDALQVTTMNAEAYRVARKGLPHCEIAPARDLSNCIERILASPRTDGVRWAFHARDSDYLAAEIEKLIYGHGIDSRSMYVAYDRAGRRRGLRREIERPQVWDIFEAVQAELRNTYDYLGFEDLTRDALAKAQPEYDYVFVDEAQDLSPNAIRLCVALAKDQRAIYVTADINQTIYGGRISWSTISSCLRFTGKTTLLARSYRCTREICAGIAELSQGRFEADTETLKPQPVYSGPKPVLQYYGNEQTEVHRIAEFLRQAVNDAGLPMSAAVILVRSARHGKALCEKLPSAFKPMFATSKDFQIDHAGLLITTVQAAKGLEFPIVVVVSVNEGNFPMLPFGNDDASADELANELRLLHVACSRASRSLMVMTASGRASRFLKHVTGVNWDIRQS